MRILSKSTLAAALEQWGLHEASGRLREQAELGPNNRLAAIGFAIRNRSPLVSRLLAREPLQTLIVEFEPADVNNILFANGSSIASWLNASKASGGESLEYFNKLVTGEASMTGKLVCAAKPTSKAPLQLNKIVVYDGSHRIAAWAERNTQGHSATIQSFLIISDREDPLFQV